MSNMPTPSENTPFLVETIGKRRVVIRFDHVCDQPRSLHQEQTLKEIIEKHAWIACDLSRTRQMGSDWIRFLALLVQKAQRAGKVCAIVAMNKVLRQTSDVLGLEDKLIFVKTVEEVWEL